MLGKLVVVRTPTTGLVVMAAVGVDHSLDLDAFPGRGDAGSIAGVRAFPT